MDPDPYAITWEALVYADGSVYQGLALGGRPHGRGALLNSFGDSYAGDFTSGQPDGYGVYTWPDGSSYAGRMYRGHLHGCGRRKFTGIASPQLGEFLDDIFVGDHLSCSREEAEGSATAATNASAEARALLVKPLEEQVHGALKATGVTKGKVKRGAPGVLFKLGSISSKCADRLYRCKVNCSIYPNNSGRCDV